MRQFPTFDRNFLDWTEFHLKMRGCSERLGEIDFDSMFFLTFRLQWNFSPRHHTNKNDELHSHSWSTGSSITSTSVTTTRFDNMSMTRPAPLRGNKLTLQRRRRSSSCRRNRPARAEGPARTPFPARRKRSCVRITTKQRKNILAAFRERGDMSPVETA